MNNASPVNEQGIAIIALEGKFPGASNVDEFWQNIHDGVEFITFFSDEELRTAGVETELLQHPAYVKANGILKDCELFDAGFFGYSPKEAALMDPQQRIFLECAWAVMEKAGYTTDAYQGLVGIYAGGTMSSYMVTNLLANPDILAESGLFQTILSNDKDFIATRTAYKLNLTGPAITVQTACSTSLVAVHMACQSLLQYECDIALAGGVSISVPQKTGYLYEEGSIASPDGHCRAFDADAHGTVSGSGVGIVALKRLADALEDGDTIHAVIRGSAINNDGSAKVGYTAPSIEGQAKAIAEALTMADVDPETITHIETHGTGTTLGDPIEIAALKQAFQMYTQKRGYCALSSVKTNIGHLDAAAGITGLIKTVQMLKHRTLPPSLHFKQPNPKIDFANSPFYINTKTTEWRTSSGPLRAGVSSFGIGGTNAHVIVEEAPTVTPRPTRQVQHVITLSARSTDALDTITEQLATYVSAHPEEQLADIAYTLQVGRKQFSHRRTLIAKDRTQLLMRLRGQDPLHVYTHTTTQATQKIIFLFPGQGAQYVQMAADLYYTQPPFQSIIDTCAEILQPIAGYDLRHILFPATKQEEEQATLKLTMTSVTQLALFVIEYGLAKLLMHFGIQPAAMLGHSIGEYIAACLADVFSLEDALHIVYMRGQLMQQLPGGSMLSVSLPEAEIQPWLTHHLALAAHNGPTFSVISGPTR